MKLSEKQKTALQWMQKYPNDMVMFNGWMTGGHGVKIKLNTIRSLEKIGLVLRGKLTESGKKYIL